MHGTFRVVTVIAVCLLTILNSCVKQEERTINFRLLWVPQAQFAGYIVAKEKGFYQKRGLNVVLLPAGPDLKPHLTVANRTDQIGVSVPNSIIAARSNGAPLVAIAQMFQDSPNRYVLKKANRVDSLQQLKGRKVGLWLGGDEAEFVSMLKTANMTLSDVDVVPQEFSVIPFLQDQYVLSMVTVYNELYQIEKQEHKNDLQILSPKDYNSAIPGDMLFCRADYLEEHFQIVCDFLEASIQGWQYCIDNPNEAIDLTLKNNPELNRDEQLHMLQACIELMKSGSAIERGIGFINERDYDNAQRILMDSKQIDRTVDIKATINLEPWKSIADSVKKF